MSSDDMSHDAIEARKTQAESGWLADPAPSPPRAYVPGEENKWYKMVGATYLLRKREGWKHRDF